MWERLIEFTKQLLTVVDNQERQEDEIRKLQQQLHDQSQKHADEIRELRSFVERLALELQQARQREESERRILKPALKNHLLRQERGLPPAQSERRTKAASDEPTADSEEQKDQ